MPSKPIVTVPDPIIKKISEPVEKLTNEELKLIKIFQRTMYDVIGSHASKLIPKKNSCN